jgi:hypothetical protein
MRPQTIVNFERVNIGALALGLVQDYVSWGTPKQQAIMAHHSLLYFAAIQLFSFGLIVALTLLVSRRRSKIALWILVILFVLGVPATVLMAVRGQLLGSSLISLIQCIAELVALIFVFTPSARRWMKGEKLDAELSDIFA